MYFDAFVDVFLMYLMLLLLLLKFEFSHEKQKQRRFRARGPHHLDSEGHEVRQGSQTFAMKIDVFCNFFSILYERSSENAMHFRRPTLVTLTIVRSMGPAGPRKGLIVRRFDSHEDPTRLGLGLD